MPHAIRRHHQSPRAIRRPPAGFRPRSVGASADHPPSPRTLSACHPRTIRRPTERHPPPTSARHPPSPHTSRQNEQPSSGLQNHAPTKCLPRIVNCPLQTKPVFYFLFTSKTPRTHRIRVKSSLLRLGRFCLSLPRCVWGTLAFRCLAAFGALALRCHLHI